MMVMNDPHFFIPLADGNNLCFSVQGQPDFMFSLIKDQYVQLNGQFVSPSEDESHTIGNGSTFLGSLGLILRHPVTDKNTVIRVSAQDHTVMFHGSIIKVKDEPVIIQVTSSLTVDITIGAKQQTNTVKDRSAWAYINTELGFGMKVRFYKHHLDMFFTNTSGLAKDTHGLIGTAAVKIAYSSYSYSYRYSHSMHVAITNGYFRGFQTMKLLCYQIHS